jgi:signal transduction histidine kinase
MNFQLLKPFKNPSSRIFWVVLIGYAVVCLYFTLWQYYRQCNQAEESALLRLEGIANSLALQIDADAHKKITEKYTTKDAILYNTQDTNYYKLHYALRRNFEANMLKSPTYTMVFDTTQKVFEFIATSSDSPYYRHVYDSFQPVLKAKYTEGGIIPMYMDRFGMWISAFAPIRNGKGETVGIVMVDEQFDIFMARAREAAWRNLAVALFIILPVILLLIYMLRRMIFREARLKKKLEEAYETNLKISQELEKSYEKLSSVDKLRKEMIANISHDLRTPLTSLSGFIETLYLRRKDITLPEREQYLTIAMKESDRLKKLIDDLFELSKLEANQVNMNAEAFPIAELLQDVIAKYEVICQEKGITISSNLSEQTPWVVADIKLIDRVLQNLLDNAIKYNLEADGRIDLILQKVDNQLFIKVHNLGKTIDPSVLPQLFDRYFKISSSDNSTGLGLAIVKKIVDLHQSEIIVESQNGETTFSFYLPIYVS